MTLVRMFYQLHGNINTCLEKKNCLCAFLSSPSQVEGKIVLDVEKKKTVTVYRIVVRKNAWESKFL